MFLLVPTTVRPHAIGRVEADPPMLAINSRVSESEHSEHSEQHGFASLVRGAFGMFRNATAHEPRMRSPMTQEDAEDLLSLVSLIHRRLDTAPEQAMRAGLARFICTVEYSEKYCKY